MSTRSGSAREALLAELLGDIHLLIERVERAEGSAQKTTQALNEATEAYRSQADAMVSKLRTETASFITQTTEHAARSLVSQQAATLEQAAREALEHVLTAQFLRRTRREHLMAAGVAALTGAAASFVAMTLRSLW